MPSASKKDETKPSEGGLEPIKQCLVILEKKIRSLEKRKTRLDLVKTKNKKGEKLEKDQQVALAHYEAVVGNLEFAHELQKTYTTLSSDVDKLARKNARRERAERRQQDAKKVRDVLHLQGLLDSLGSEVVRSDFQTGKHGAVVLTEDNLNQFDELFKLISPSREEEEDYNGALTKASEHIMNLLDGTVKPVVGTTYKELKELVDLIAGCGYFEKASQAETEEAKEESQEAPETEQEGEQTVDSQVDTTGEASEVTPVQLPAADNLLPTGQMDTDLLTTPPTVPQGTSSGAAEADSFFSGANTASVVQQQQQQQQQQHQHQHQQQQQQQQQQEEFQRQRPFQEIVSSVQGNFNFLQESTIDMESPHMDPAVVAAHPMPTAPSMARAPTTTVAEVGRPSAAAGYGASAYTEHKPPAAVAPAPGDQMSALLQQHSQAQMPIVKPVQQQNQDFGSANFGQSSLSQGLQSDTSLFSSTVDKSSVPNVTHSVLGQSAGEPSISQFDMPPSIPMPPGQDQSQEQSEKKTFTMNPNAGEFQSMLFSPTEGNGDEAKPGDMSADQSSFQGDNFSGFQQQPYGHRNTGRGGYRSGDTRGGRGNRGNMSNGYSRGGRGGNNSNFGGYNQGYQQRGGDYNKDGYQGYRDGGRFNNDYSRRGGPSRGNSRGTGGMRGGTFNRGGPRGGAGRGGNNPNTGGGFGRPNFNQQQPVAQQ